MCCPAVPVRVQSQSRFLNCWKIHLLDKISESLRRLWCHFPAINRLKELLCELLDFGRRALETFICRRNRSKFSYDLLSNCFSTFDERVAVLQIPAASCPKNVTFLFLDSFPPI
jgi:hypothetical protein